MLMGEITPDAGTITWGHQASIGSLAQDHREGIPNDTTVSEWLHGIDPSAGIGGIRGLLGKMLFSGDEGLKPTKALSGGEAVRLLFAKLMLTQDNVLILDEPTNHLDIPSAERLEEALSLEGGFDGTLILISHDRAFLDAVCDRLIVLDGKGNARTVLGTYSEWAVKQREELAQQRAREAEETAKREEQQRKRDAAKQAKPDATKADPSANALARMKTDQIEAKIEKIETRLREIDAQLADPETWRDAERTDRLAQERTKLAGELEPLEFEWSRRADSA
jgi:ATPase subunit of ABC transporter with duplicated ATPase domains